jgi:hypothetical protein
MHLWSTPLSALTDKAPIHVDLSLGRMNAPDLHGYELFNLTVGHSQGSEDYSMEPLSLALQNGERDDPDWDDILVAFAEGVGPSSVVVKTAFDVKHKNHVYELHGAAREKTEAFTEVQRDLASLAEEPKDLEDFQRLVSGFVCSA